MLLCGKNSYLYLFTVLFDIKVELEKRKAKKARIYFRKSAGLPLSSVVCCPANRRYNLIPQEDSRNNSKEMKELLGYMARHHEDLEKTFTDEQKEIFEKFHVAKSETIEYRFGRVKPPGATIRQS